MISSKINCLRASDKNLLIIFDFESRSIGVRVLLIGLTVKRRTALSNDITVKVVISQKQQQQVIEQA